MRRTFGSCAPCVCAALVLLTAWPAAAQSDPPAPAQPSTDISNTANADWVTWTSGRYRITPGDVLEISFPFVPELNQTLAVQPDGYITLREVGDVRVLGQTLPDVRAGLLDAYGGIVRDPVITVGLKEFEKPYFVASGQLAKPGRYDLRGATTLTQALAYAGGPTSGAKLSEVVLFRRYTADSVSVRQVNVKAMYDKRDLSEDPLLRPGDMILVPKSVLGKLSPIMPRLNLGLYFNPADLIR